MVKIQMSEIRTTKIDGQEFVTLTDYLIAQEEIKQLKNQIKHLIKWDKSVWESLIQVYKDLEYYDKEDD